MQQEQTPPWAGLTIALVTCAIGALVGVTFWLAVAIFIVWGGSLFLATSTPPQMPVTEPKSPFTKAGIEELIEHSATPMLMTEQNRVAIANEAARNVLGDHIVGQDVRVAFRHPEAIALLDQSGPGTTIVQGLSRRNDIWQMNRQQMDDHFAVIELINQSAEAQISRAHTDFVANASHELRTPLASIIGYVETLSDEEDTVPPATKKKFLGTILSEANRLQSLVSDLMSLSRVEAEKYDEPGEDVDLKGLVERSARDAAGAERLARIKYDCAEQVTVRGDARQLEQLVRNLVDNALKYGAPTGDVLISLTRDSHGDAQLSVKDRGEGIDAEHIPHLTRRFYRTDPGRSRASGGTGLGLAIVKHIVERHRGRLDIASEVGQGTTVEVRLPLKRT